MVGNIWYIKVSKRAEKSLDKIPKEYVPLIQQALFDLEKKSVHRGCFEIEG